MVGKRDKGSLVVKSRFHEVEARRAIEVMLHVILPIPQQLDGRAHFTGDPCGLGHEVALQPAAKSAAAAHHVNGHVLFGEAQRFGYQLLAGARILCGRPKGDLSVAEMRRAVLRLKNDMREEGIGIGRLHHLGCAL